MNRLQLARKLITAAQRLSKLQRTAETPHQEAFNDLQKIKKSIEALDTVHDRFVKKHDSVPATADFAKKLERAHQNLQQMYEEYEMAILNDADLGVDHITHE